MVSKLERLLGEVWADTEKAVVGLSLSSQRLWKGIESYLNARRLRPEIDVLARHLHGHDQGKRLHKQIAGRYETLVRQELQLLNCTLVSANARLLLAMVQEAARAERDHERVLPQYREPIRQLLWSIHA